MSKQIGPTFGDELHAAGLGGLPFSWCDDGSYFIEQLTDEQTKTFLEVLMKHDPAKQRRDPLQARLEAIEERLAALERRE
jgi:hypothetical protein